MVCALELGVHLQKPLCRARRERIYGLYQVKTIGILEKQLAQHIIHTAHHKHKHTVAGPLADLWQAEVVVQTLRGNSSSTLGA